MNVRMKITRSKVFNIKSHSLKNLMAFVPFLMLHHYSGIIYLILCTLHPLPCHLEEPYNLIYSTKPFLLNCLPYQKSFLAFNCALYSGCPLWTSWLRTSVYRGSQQLVDKKISIISTIITITI